MTPSTTIAPYRKPGESGTIGASEWRYVCREFMKSKHRMSRPNTVRNLSTSHRWLAEFLDTNGSKLISVRKGRPEVLSEFVQYVFKSFNSLNAARRVCTDNFSVIRWMVAADMIDRDFTVLVSMPAGENTKEKQQFTPTEYQQMLEAAKAWRGGKMLWLLVLGHETGASISDCCLMKWASWDAKKMMLTFGRLKTGAVQHVPVTPGGQLHQMLKERALEPRSEKYPNDPKAGVYFMDTVWAETYMKGGELAPNLFMAFLDHVGIQGKSFHSFRVGLATRLVAAGVGHIQVCQIMGWKDVDQVMTYAKPDHSSLHPQMQLANAMAQATGAVPQMKEIL